HPEMIFYRSDHYNFAKFGIPVIFYYSGEHADYHKPTDTVDKIDFDQMLKRMQLIFVTTWKLANRTERIKLNNQ
ncbi:MAG TPA: M28 family peptidase, partial [Flavobacterium sp.]|nr:M28 family peptidase [Flavobacterium sp.]